MFNYVLNIKKVRSHNEHDPNCNRAPSVFQQQPRHMGPPGPGGPGGPGAPEGAMPPPTAPAEPHDNGPAAPATALVTTGPDGAPLDEGSQQSTLSNASAGMIP